MRQPALIAGGLLVAVGILIAMGLFRWEETDKVIDLGRLEVEATQEKRAPLNWGYVLIAGGALVMVAGALARR